MSSELKRGSIQNKQNRERKTKQKTKYLFFNKLTLELVRVLKALTVDLDDGTISLSHVTQTLVLQLCDLWDLVFTTTSQLLFHLLKFADLQSLSDGSPKTSLGLAVCLSLCLFPTRQHTAVIGSKSWEADTTPLRALSVSIAKIWAL